MGAFPPEVVAGFWTLVLAILAGLTLYVRGLAAGQSQHTEALAGIQGAISDVKANLAGGGSPAQLPAYDQLADPNPDGTMPTGRANECGEECAAMVVAWVHGVPMEADYLRYLLGGARRQPLTTGADLVRILALCNVRSSVGSPATGDLAAQVQKINKAGGLAIMLGAWLDPGILHWIVATASSINGCTVTDPWGGRRYNLAWSKAESLYGGTLVEVLSRPDRASA